jgi:hypothetical protein
VNRPGLHDGDEFHRCALQFDQRPTAVRDWAGLSIVLKALQGHVYDDLGIFTHGFPYGLNLRRDPLVRTAVANAKDVAELLLPLKLRSLSLFACCTAGRPVADHDGRDPVWTGKVFAQELSRLLPGVYVAGQEQSAHVTDNPWDVLFLDGKRLYQAPRSHRGATREQVNAWVKYTRPHGQLRDISLDTANPAMWQAAEKALGFKMGAT